MIIFSEIDGWSVFTLEFTTGSWLLFILSLLIHMCVIILIRKYISVTDVVPPLLVYIIAVQQPVPTSGLPKTSVLRVYTIAMLVQAILVVSMYNSKLASNFAGPQYLGDINTMEDFAESDLEWGSTEASHAIPLATDPKVCYMNILVFCVFSFVNFNVFIGIIKDNIQKV